MKIKIENLAAQMQGFDLNVYQKADALIEFNKLIDYVIELEQSTIPVVVSSEYCYYKEGINMQCASCDEPKYKHKY